MSMMATVPYLFPSVPWFEELARRAADDDELHRLGVTDVRAGLQIGDRIAMLSKNSIEYVLLYFAASKAGVVPVPLNYRLAPADTGNALGPL